MIDTYKNIGLRFLFLDLKMPPPFLKNVSEPHAQKCAETSPSVSGSKNNLKQLRIIHTYILFSNSKWNE